MQSFNISVNLQVRPAKFVFAILVQFLNKNERYFLFGRMLLRSWSLVPQCLLNEFRSKLLLFAACLIYIQLFRLICFVSKIDAYLIVSMQILTYPLRKICQNTVFLWSVFWQIYAVYLFNATHIYEYLTFRYL